MTEKFKFKTKVYDGNEYVLVNDLKLLDLHYCIELNTANNMMHDLNSENKKLRDVLKEVEAVLDKHGQI